jgi:hypothetical protein
MLLVLGVQNLRSNFSLFTWGCGRRIEAIETISSLCRNGEKNVQLDDLRQIRTKGCSQNRQQQAISANLKADRKRGTNGVMILEFSGPYLVIC